MRRHPDTGDLLTFSEWVSWQVQGVIRTWWFVGAWTGLTGLWWAFPGWFHDPARLWWNFTASWLAVTVELVIGISLFRSTIRDSVILRRIERLEEHTAEQVDDIMEELEHEQDDR